MRDSRRRAFALATIAALLLAGCGADKGRTDTTRSQEPAPEEETVVGSGVEDDLAGSEGRTECMLGEWRLDLADYTAQANDWMRSLGIPLDEHTMSGQYALIVSVDQISIFASLVSDAIVYGHPVSVPTQFEGIGNWYWEGDQPSAISVHDWEFLAPPTLPEDAEFVPPAVFDPSLPGAIAVACDGDTLSIKGPEAPLAGNLTRWD